MGKLVGDCSISILHMFLRIKYGYRNMRERAQVKNKPVRLTSRGYKVMMYDLYFSLLWTLHIRWKDSNAESWIDRMRPNEYTLKGNVGGR